MSMRAEIPTLELGKLDRWKTKNEIFMHVLKPHGKRSYDLYCPPCPFHITIKGKAVGTAMLLNIARLKRIELNSPLLHYLSKKRHYSEALQWFRDKGIHQESGCDVLTFEWLAYGRCKKHKKKCLRYEPVVGVHCPKCRSIEQQRLKRLELEKDRIDKKAATIRNDITRFKNRKPSGRPLKAPERGRE